MGHASSSAVRIDEAYGSLGGAFGGTGRKLKKKPVLVLDPEELAKAHQLFQISAAEQLGEFDPKEGASRPAVPMFGHILGGATINRPDYDEDDDYVAPLELAEDEEEPEEDLPPIDLDALLTLSRAEQEEEDAFYREIPKAEAEPEAEVEASSINLEPEPTVAAPEHAAMTGTPADALARIISRAAAQRLPFTSPKAAPGLELPTSSTLAAEPELTEQPALPQPDLVVWPSEPAWHTAEQAAYEDELIQTANAPFDLQPQNEFDGEAYVRPEAPLRVLPIMGEAGTRSLLRARLVREDLTLAQPELSGWSKMMNTLRRWRVALPF